MQSYVTFYYCLLFRSTIASPTKSASSQDKDSSLNSSPSQSQLTSSSASDRSSPEISNDEATKPSENIGALLPPSSSSLSSATNSLQNQNLVAASRNGCVQLQIITQPEQQHRARYQTEGSRGAVKDKSGNGFPVVKLNGYNKPATLQVSHRVMMQ
jgi:hypothetical protein